MCATSNQPPRPSAALGPEALGELLDRHGPGLALYVRQWTASPEDIVQQAFVHLARQATAPRDVASWLYRVARNAAISAARADQRRARHEAAAAELAPVWFEPGDRNSVDAADVTAALAELRVELREVIVARLWANLTFEQIAELVGASSSAVHRRYQAGLAALRDRLESPARSDSSVDRQCKSIQ